MTKRVKQGAAKKGYSVWEETKNPILQYLENNSILIRTFSFSLDVTEQAIRNWIARTNSPSTANRIKLSQEFGLSLSEFNDMWDAWESLGQDDDPH